MSNAPEFGQGEGTLTRAAGLVSDARADFNSISSTLSDQISNMQARWGGQGAKSFFVLHQTWTQKQKQVTDALDNFSNSLTLTERDNLNTDDTQSSNFGNLANRLS